MRHGLVIVTLGALTATIVGAQDQDATLRALVARGRSLDLGTPYVPVPGDPLEHHAAGYANVMCSAVFISGRVTKGVVRHTASFTKPPTLGFWML